MRVFTQNEKRETQTLKLIQNGTKIKDKVIFFLLFESNHFVAVAYYVETENQIIRTAYTNLTLHEKVFQH